MVTVGSVMLTKGRASTCSGAQTVSPMPMSSMPLMATMSPIEASLAGTRLRPSKVYRLVRRSGWETFSVSKLVLMTVMPSESVPRAMRPMPMRPT